MAENCARPGCGHQRTLEPLPFGDRALGHHEAGCAECRCLGYRTPEQQSAWDRADKAARAWIEESSFGDHAVDIGLGGQMLDAIIRLRKLYS